MSTELEEALKRERPGHRVLTIQSHVVSGYAGNKGSVFPLQINGFEVDIINSVQFSNHTGYENGIRGQRLTDADLQDLYEGLKANKLTKYSYVMSGYCGNPTFLRRIADVVRDLKAKNPNLLYVCDPVLGDNGKYYAPKECMPVFRDEILKVADIITPNIFELSELTGQRVQTEAECREAMRNLHRTANIRVVVVTSGIYAEGREDLMYCYASEWLPSAPGTWNDADYSLLRFDIPVIRGAFVGTGDVFSSLLVVWYTHFNGDLQRAICNVISSMQGLLRRTSQAAYGGRCSCQWSNPGAAERELRLVESRYDLLVPQVKVNCVRIP
ncbi:Protein F57C9.1 c [Aphelenchoides avenae]|nr:Protein F57C9.1 c [Aphelenchus avenae]